jgi:hypothetical protein
MVSSGETPQLLLQPRIVQVPPMEITKLSATYSITCDSREETLKLQVETGEHFLLIEVIQVLG